MIKYLFSIALSALMWTGNATFDNLDFTYNDPLKTRIVAHGDEVTITQGDETTSCALGKGKMFDGDSGESVEEFQGLATDKNAVRSWAIAYFQRGGMSPDHFHNLGIEDYFTLTGLGRMRRGDETIELRPGVFVNIPTNTIHNVINSEDNGNLIIAVKCAPSWVFTDHNIVTK